MAVKDDREFGELMDGPSTLLRYQPPALRPPTDNTDDLGIDELGACTSVTEPARG